MHERRFHPSRAHLLENPERKTWLPPDTVVSALRLRPGEDVVDVGAGTGYFALPIAAAVGAAGHVFAVDVSPEMLDLLRGKLPHAGLANVQCVEGEASATHLPAQCAALVFMANVWHEFDDHAAVLAEARRLLQPEGRIALLDWRPDADPEHGPPIEHRVPATAAQASLQAAGFTIDHAENTGRYSWLVIGQVTVSST